MPLSASVVIVTADRPNQVRRCLDSICPQLPDDCDVLVVDASCDEQTEKIARSFPRARYIRSSIRNMCAQRNLGIRASEKEIVVFIDDDAIAQKDWLRHLLNGYDDPKISSVVGAVREDDLPTYPANSKFHLSPYGPSNPITNWQNDKPCAVLNGRGCNMSFRRQSLSAVGMFDETYQAHCHGEEMDVFVRLRRAGGTVLFDPRALVVHQPAQTHGYLRSASNRRFMFWLGRNNAYGNTKLFFGRKEFFWYFGYDTLRFIVLQIGRLFRAIANNILVTVFHLTGRLCGFLTGLQCRLKGTRRQQKAMGNH